ncbi:MAG: DivIVA domain-containing protein [Gaiellaceae bacterium]
MSSDTNKLRRAWLRGFRQGDVELAIARGTLLQEQLQHELDASRARTEAMQVEIAELHRRVESFRQRENELSKTLDDVRDRREQVERDATIRGETIVGEAEQRAAALRTEGLRQVGELQQQVEQLIGLRAGLSAALKRVTQDIADALDRLAAAPARAVEQIPPHPAAEPAAGDADERFAPWSNGES